MDTTTEVPDQYGEYEILRARGEYRMIAGAAGGSLLCAHPGGPRRKLRVWFAGAAARALPRIIVGSACGACQSDYESAAAADDGGPVWAGDPLPVVRVDVLSEATAQ